MSDGPAPCDAVRPVFERQHHASRQAPAPDLAMRRSRLTRLGALIDLDEAAWARAVAADFGHRSPHETRMAELAVLQQALRHAGRHLERWMAPRRVPTAWTFRPGYNRLLPQPLGVVGVVSPWNYPLQLSLGPAIGALAAGNRVLIKPSELTPHCNALLARRIREHFDPAELGVVEGDAEVARAFVALPFDHLCFTGSAAVGREVARAAAAQLTPLTLELGGKSPAILDASADLARALPRLATGKLLNAGQTCIAPDHLCVPAGQAAAIAARLAAAMAALYPTLRDNPDYTAIIDERHRQRLRGWLEEARAAGATVIEVNPANETFEPSVTGKLPPTLVLGAPPHVRLMREEIFGPVLPIVEYDSLEALLAHLQAGDRPLALYWFGRDRARLARVLHETHAGGVTVNDCLLHLAQEGQPFGGVGASGMGAYHGRWGFERFSHLKPVFHQAAWAASDGLRPPYGRHFERLMALVRRWG